MSEKGKGNKRNVFVDDLTCGDNEEKAFLIKAKATKAFADGGFILRKFHPWKAMPPTWNQWLHGNLCKGPCWNQPWGQNSP